MNTQLPNPLLGTFLVEEYEGKKYKMLFVEEVKEELTDWEIVSKISHFLQIPNDTKISDTSTDALFLINHAIREENSKQQDSGNYSYYWYYRTDIGQIQDLPLLDNANISVPLTAARSRETIEKVVEKLGVDIFRIAAGVKKD